MTEPRKAATLILLRDGMEGLEVFLLRRHAASGFVGGAYVFPGGVLDAEDHIEESLCAGMGDAEASEALGLDRGGLAYWIAAIRECFEEAGIFLAYRKGGEILQCSEPDAAARYDAHRQALIHGNVYLADICRRENLVLATDRIHYWAHWITPEGEPRRYDTRFFVAAAPDQQRAAHDGRELTTSCWVKPEVALRKARAGEWMIILPTEHNLVRLSGCTSSKAALAEARKRRPVPCIQPRPVSTDRGIEFLIPGDPGYDEAG